MTLRLSVKNVSSPPNKLSGLLTGLICLIFLSSCTTTQYEPVAVDIRDIESVGSNTVIEQDAKAQTIQETAVLTPKADTLKAARAEYYRQQAIEQDDQNARVEATLSSAEYFVQANQPAQAAELIQSIQEIITSKNHFDRSNIVSAYVDYAQGQYLQALSRLEPLIGLTNHNASENSLNFEQNTDTLAADSRYHAQHNTIDLSETLSVQQVDALLLSSFCYQALNNNEQAITALIRRESGLTGSARAETTRYLWQVINAIPLQQRKTIVNESTNTQVKNRVAQSLTGEIGTVTQAPQQFNQWREEPISPIKSTMESAWSGRSPKSIYVLLPMSSRFNKAAMAVKAGIEHEHDLNDSVDKPSVHFYDVGDNPLQITQYYDSALRSGADFIIGPIGTSYSNEANNSSRYVRSYQTGSNTVPMLMLGGDQALTPGNYRLSMTPEMEGRRVAERAWQDGHLSAGVLLSNSVQDQRTMNGFTQKWLSLGGKLTKAIEVNTNLYDHSAELKQLFGINQSEYRHQSLSRTLGFKPKFTAYQRRDLDFVFMIAEDKVARILRPQINFYTTTQMPVYATSTIYNGIKDEINNMDLDKTLFPVMPWVARSAQVSPYAGQLNMLYAMGMDAYLIAGNLNRLETNAELSMRGNMGQLQLVDSDDIVFRSPWAKFIKGELNIVDAKDFNLIPLKQESLGNGSIDDNSSTPSIEIKNSRGSYNDQTWDAGESRRKTGG